jgi:acyl-lipid omega-6 desaturase (Delta-12 desaturase)
VLQFFTGNIGLHHVHHLSARVPNYHLQRAHDDNPIFHNVPVVTLWQGLRASRLKLWDPDLGRLVGFATPPDPVGGDTRGSVKRSAQARPRSPVA